MSCNGCRVLRKGCSDACLLRAALQCIETADAQGHATLFVAKFFGRAGLLSFISNVPPAQRPALFQSLLFEAAGRTINPVSGAAGLLSTNNWHLCQQAVHTVLQGGALRPLNNDDHFDCPQSLYTATPSAPKRPLSPSPPCDLDLYLTPREDKRQRRPATPSEGSVTTTTSDGEEPKLLDLFV